MKKLMKVFVFAFLIIVTCLAVGVCDPVGNEPHRVELPVVASGAPLDVCVNDLGWQISVSKFRLAVRNFEFSLEGEVHDAHNLSNWITPNVMAHPGHLGGGDVTGEMAGEFLLDFGQGIEKPLGSATLIIENYFGMNFYFRKATLSDVQNSDDLLLGHTAHIEGTATKDGVQKQFVILADVDDGVQMVGAPFEYGIDESTQSTLVVNLFMNDPTELGETLFDRIDFQILDTDNDGIVVIMPGAAEHNIIMKTIKRHDHFSVVVRNQ